MLDAAIVDAKIQETLDSDADLKALRPKAEAALAEVTKYGGWLTEAEAKLSELRVKEDGTTMPGRQWKSSGEFLQAFGGLRSAVETQENRVHDLRLLHDSAVKAQAQIQKQVETRERIILKTVVRNLAVMFSQALYEVEQWFRQQIRLSGGKTAPISEYTQRLDEMKKVRARIRQEADRVGLLSPISGNEGLLTAQELAAARSRETLDLPEVQMLSAGQVTSQEWLAGGLGSYR